MTSKAKSCPKCGTAILEEAPQGLCPKCLLSQGALLTEPGTVATPKTPAPSLADLGAAFPQLEILELIGRGGMGFVFKARQPKLERFVALKILPDSLAADPAFAERFTREGRMLARLNHPNIVTVHDFGQANGFFYLLMEYVDGVNLRQAMSAGRFTPEQAMAVVPKICDALQFAHNEGILHRDIKPENILLDSKGRVKIADFGIAKIVGAQAAAPSGGSLEAAEHNATGAIGTPQYMAPEQFDRPQEVDQRADIYSLGVVFYEMLTGELPLGRFAPPSAVSSADPRLDHVVLRTLEKQKEDRYPGADILKTEVETILNQPWRFQQPTERAMANGFEYRSKRTLFGLPLIHVTLGTDPLTGRRRIARGIIAVGDMAQGVFAFGGIAMGIFSFGGLSLGAFAFGGGAAGLVVIGGWAIGLIAALGGLAIAPIAIGGAAAGYFANGGKGFGAHVLDAFTRDPAAVSFFTPWAQTLISSIPALNKVFVPFIIMIGVGVPLWLRKYAAKRRGEPGIGSSGNRKEEGMRRPASLILVGLLFLAYGGFNFWQQFTQEANSPPTRAFFICLLALPIGIGVLRLRPWWRIAGFVFLLFGFGLILFTGLITGGISAGVLPILAVPVWMYYVLARPVVKQLFRRRGFDRPWVEWGVLMVALFSLLSYGGGKARFLPNPLIRVNTNSLAQLIEGSVELLAIRGRNAPTSSTNDLEEWWKPNGEPIEDFEFERALRPAGPQSAGENDSTWRTAVFKTKGFTDETEFVVKAAPTKGFMWDRKGDEKGRSFLTVGLRVSPEVKTMTIRVGVANGPWINGHPITGIRDQGSAGNGFSRLGIQWRVKIQIIEQVQNGTRVIAYLTDNEDWQSDFVLVDLTGKEWRLQGTSETADGLRHISGTCAVPLSRIKECYLRIRPYHWVEFQNVSMHSGVRTAFFVEQRSPVPALSGANAN